MSNTIDDLEQEQGGEDEAQEGSPKAPAASKRGASPQASAAPSADEDDTEDAEEERQPRERRDRRRSFSNARELMTDELRQRAESSSERLRACLGGTIVIRLRDRADKFVFDWTGSAPKAELTDMTTGDCVIDLNENTLLKIASGDLNPQIGMLSDKISVQGRLSLAVYFFNLIAPYPQQ